MRNLNTAIPHLFILGPTASGKSATALALARETGAVVANVDAFQVYRGLDIGTGKPTADERRSVPHALFDLVEATDDFNVADYLRQASEFLRTRGKGNVPVVWVGGTGLYYRALRQGLTTAPATDPEVRRDLEALPLDRLREEILRVDPAWASAADLNNPRRLVRALAVYRQTGRPLSAWHAERPEPLVPTATACLLVQPPELLRARITARVHAMWRQGWPDEVRRLLELPGWEGSASSRALGYAEVAAWCREGGDSEAVCDRIATRTWQYARRQLTWFRRELNLIPIEIDERSDPSLIARAMLRAGVPPSS